MRRFRKSTVAAAALATMLLPAAGFAASEHHEARGAAGIESGPEGTRVAHMGGGMSGMMAPRQGYAPGPCPYGMSPGMMGPGMMGPGMMGGMMNPGMGPMMGPGMMQGMGRGMMEPGQGSGMMPGAGADLSADDVRARLQRSLEWHGNPRLEVGEVTETDADTITAEIVTKDGSLVQRFVVDRHSGAMRQAQ